MIFQIQDNRIAFEVQKEGLDFRLQEAPVLFDLEEQGSSGFDIADEEAQFVPDLAYSSGTSPIPAYTGAYTVIPSAANQQVLNTGGYRMTDNVTVTKIQYAEVSNTYGTTVSIATA